MHQIPDQQSPKSPEQRIREAIFKAAKVVDLYPMKYHINQPDLEILVGEILLILDEVQERKLDRVYIDGEVRLSPSDDSEPNGETDQEGSHRS